MARIDRTEAIHAALEEAGYELIQFDVESAGRVEADVVAWAADAGGELVPWAVIEVKEWGHGQRTRPELGLSPLSRARSAFGSQEHYVVANGEWFKADAGLRKLERVPAPTPPPNGTRGQVHDVSRAIDLMHDVIRRNMAQAPRPDGNRGDFFWPQEEGQVAGLGMEALPGAPLPASPEVIWEAKRRALVEHAASSDVPEHVSSQVVAKAVAALAASRLTSDVFDPFCGTGSFLWEAIEVARERGHRLQSVLGWDINRQAVALARSIAVAAPVPAEIRSMDAFHPTQNNASHSIPLSMVVLSAPPQNLKLSEPYELSSGGQTKDGEVAAIDLAVSALGEGGRAVLHVGRGFTHRASAERFRAFLARDFRVSAVIGLPGGSQPGTQAGTVLIVIDRATPRPAFVAQLGNDWQTQLGAEGAALLAAIAYVDGTTEPAALLP
jgi:hypothetical protein